MERILSSGGDVFTQHQWQRELRIAVSHSFAPHHITSANEPYHFATSANLRKSVNRLLRWACTQIQEPLAVEALKHAATCSHFVVLKCCAIDVGCCFTRAQRLPKMRQVSFCDTSPVSGVIERSLFYAMHYECAKLVYCFYELGHIAQYIVDLAKRIIQASDDWISDIYVGAAEQLRLNLNQCMRYLYYFISHPPCAIRS